MKCKDGLFVCLFVFSGTPYIMRCTVNPKTEHCLIIGFLVFFLTEEIKKQKFKYTRRMKANSGLAGCRISTIWLHAVICRLL